MWSIEVVSQNDSKWFDYMLFLGKCGNRNDILLWDLLQVLGVLQQGIFGIELFLLEKLCYYQDLQEQRF